MSNPNYIDILFKLDSNYTKDEFKQKYEELKLEALMNQDEASIFVSDLDESIDSIFDTLDTTQNGKLDNDEIEALKKYFNDDENDIVSEGDLNELYKKTMERLNNQQTDISKPETIISKRTTMEHLIEARKLASQAKINSLQDELTALVTGNSNLNMRQKNKYEKNVDKIKQEKDDKRKKEAELRAKTEEQREISAEIDYIKDYKKDNESNQKEMEKLSSRYNKLTKECNSIKNSISKIDSKINELYMANNKILAEIDRENSNLSERTNMLNLAIQTEENSCKSDLSGYSAQVSELRQTEVKSFKASATPYPADYYDEDTSNFSYDSQELKSKWSKSKPNLSDGFYNKVVEISKRIGCDPNALMAVMDSESGISSTIQNSQGGATGLIQFMPQTAYDLLKDELHLSKNDPNAKRKATDYLKSITPEEQLKYVEIFLKQAKGMAKIGSNERVDSGTLYALVFMPAKAKKNVFAVDGTKEYQWNKGLDLDNDHQITKADLANRVRSRMK